ncbi:MAG: 3-deoxy-D-manno-octulosonic acid transferase [Bacteroidales bacterium]|nr:3-deoxy-D-manno-octulosonic acid transferase [Bacteroidales bacterium]
MVFVYNLGILIYQLIVTVVSPFNRKAKLWKKGRNRWESRLRETIKKDDRIVWFHCASLGEFEQGRPVIEAFREKYSDIKILLTFFSPSGYEIRKNYPKADYIFYLPLDKRRNAIKFIEIVNPIATIFVKYEFWYHYLNQLKKRNIPTYIISAIFREEQVFFKSYGKWYRSFLSNFEHLFVQNKKSQELLASIGISNVTVAGDTRFDRVMANAQAAKTISLLEKFALNSKVLVAGSTWQKDEEVILEYLKKNPHNLKLILAPHEINPQDIEKFRAKIGIKSMLYTNPNETDLGDTQVLIIDTIGILSSVYRYGTIAYIGGGFGVGIHNTLEAAVFGVPVIFGPNYQRFQEAVELIEIGSARSIDNLNSFSDSLNHFFISAEMFQKVKNSSNDYFMRKAGATKIILEKIILHDI